MLRFCLVLGVYLDSFIVFAQAQVVPAWQWWALYPEADLLMKQHNFTDLIAELSWGFICAWTKQLIELHSVLHDDVWPYDNYVLNRHAAPQNKERTGCSGEAEGVWWYPPSLWQGDESLLTRATLYILCLWYSKLCCRWCCSKYLSLPCLSNDFEKNNYLRHAVLTTFIPLPSFFLTSDSNFGFCSTEKAHGCPSRS